MKSGVSTAGVAVTVALALAVTSLHGQAQSRSTRRGGPRDWSHGRVIATRFGPDLDRNIAGNWRTQLKHVQLESVERARSLHEFRIDRFDVFQPFGRRRPTPSPEAPHLDWNLRTGGYGSVIGFPAKYNPDITANNCSDVIYFTVDHPGAAAIVNVIAITNAYAGCSGNAGGATPTVKFGLRLPFGVPTSAVPSLDGNILYVLESRPSGSGGLILHAINVANITANVGTYDFGATTWTNAHTLSTNPTGTTREQLFQLTYAAATNTLASPYLDYTTNQLFFGDSAGRVYRVGAVNTASPTTTNFPVQCGTAALQSPVFVNGQIITTSADGRIYRIDTTLAPPYTCIASVQGGEGTASGVGGGFSAPVIDVSNNKIIVVGNDALGFALRGVGVFALMFTAGAAQLSGASLGPSSATIAPMSPSFDETFWLTNNGNLYAPGAPTSGLGTYLIKVPYNGTSVGTPSGFATLNNTGAQTVSTSPVTEFLTASSLANPDFVFVGGGSGNYRYINRISSGFGGGDGSPVNMNSAFDPVGTGGVVSGIVIDNRTSGVIGATATANVYFGTVGVASTSQSLIIQLAQQF